jgi:hypothetical protein
MLRLEGVQEAIVYRGKHPVMGEIVKAKVISHVDPVVVTSPISSNFLLTFPVLFLGISFTLSISCGTL